MQSSVLRELFAKSVLLASKAALTAPRLLRNRYFIMVLALVLGMLLPNVARALRSLTLPTIVLVLIASMLRIPSSTFLPLRKVARPLLLGIVLNYLVLCTAMLTIGRWAVTDQAIWSGLVLVAAAPPGFAVVPFTHLLGGNISLSIIGSMGGYLATLVIAPILTMVFIGGNAIAPLKLLTVISEIIILPLVLSRILRRTGVNRFLEKWIGTIINWGFFLVLFIVVGLNQAPFLNEPGLVGRIAAVAVACTFLLGFVLRLVSRRLGAAEPSHISYTLLGTVKNSGWATATALALFGEKASTPGAVWSVITVLYLLALNIEASRRSR